jgi:hypothetical protein
MRLLVSQLTLGGMRAKRHVNCLLIDVDHKRQEEQSYKLSLWLL